MSRASPNELADDSSKVISCFPPDLATVTSRLDSSRASAAEGCDEAFLGAATSTPELATNEGC